MSFANWNDSYSVKVRRLDDEHKQLFSIINQLHEGMKAGRGKDVMQNVLNQLLCYTEQHFTDEEALLRLTEYAWINAHTALHQQFVNKIKSLRQDFQSGATPISVEMLEFLRNWLAQHVMGTDHQYMETLNEAGIR